MHSLPQQWLQHSRGINFSEKMVGVVKFGREQNTELCQIFDKLGWMTSKMYDRGSKIITIQEQKLSYLEKKGQMFFLCKIFCGLIIKYAPRWLNFETLSGLFWKVHSSEIYQKYPSVPQKSKKNLNLLEVSFAKILTTPLRKSLLSR